MLTRMNPKKFIYLTSFSIALTSCHTAPQLRKAQASTEVVAQAKPLKPISTAPTAGIEVIYKGKPAIKAYVNRNLLIKPTSTSMDSDDLNAKGACAQNPGVIQEAYTITKLNTREQKHPFGRQQRIKRRNCDPLGLPFKFKDPGYYFIEMSLTTNDKETAKASMVLAVSSYKTKVVSPGFRLKDTDLLREPHEIISMETVGCPKTARLNWAHNGRIHKKSDRLIHTYDSSGSYLIKVLCTLPGAGSFEASATIAVTNN